MLHNHILCYISSSCTFSLGTLQQYKLIFMVHNNDNKKLVPACIISLYLHSPSFFDTFIYIFTYIKAANPLFMNPQNMT